MTARSLTSSASPPLVAQVCFSVVSFLSITGLARHAPPAEVASVIGAYSLESVVVSFGTSRWVNLMIQREAHPLRQGDLRLITRAYLLLVLVSAPLFLGFAFVVSREWTIAIWAAIWSAAMALSDLSRSAASRYLSVPPIAAIGGLHLGFAAAFSLAFKPPPATFLGVLASAGLVAAVLHYIVLRMSCPAGKSVVWSKDRVFGQALGTEALFSSAAAGLGGALTSVLNPVMAIGLQLSNQILGTPAGALCQAIGIPMARRSRDSLGERIYPSRLLLRWSLFCLGVPVLGILLLIPTRPLIQLFLGARTEQAYFFLPVILLQLLALLPLEPLILARRWTHSPQNARAHVVSTVGFTNLCVVVVAGLSLDDTLARLILIVSGLALCATSLFRVVRWWEQGVIDLRSGGEA